MVFGQALGCGFADNMPKFVPSEVYIENSHENVLGVYAGQNRSALVLQSGKIFSWGEWFTGTKQLKPKEIPLPANQGVKKLAVGKMFLLALTGLGNVFSIGDNTYGELGQSREVKNSFKMLKIELNAQFTDIAAGARHGLALTSEGKLYTFGDNSEGQCGIEAARAYSPTEIPIKSIIGKAKCDKVFCGEAHSALMTNDGELFTWGDNTAGRLGIKGGMSVYRPRIVEDVMGKYITTVGCGGLFTTILVGPGSANMAKSNIEVLIPPN